MESFSLRMTHAFSVGEGNFFGHVTCTVLSSCPVDVSELFRNYYAKNEGLLILDCANSGGILFSEFGCVLGLLLIELY